MSLGSSAFFRELKSKSIMLCTEASATYFLLTLWSFEEAIMREVTRLGPYKV